MGIMALFFGASVAAISATKIHHRVTSDRGFDAPCSLAIGSFDGVHLGHQSIIRKVVEQAKNLGIKSRLLTFYPRPSEYFAPGKTLPSLMSWREKVSFLSGFGLDDVICMPFNQSFSKVSAKDFIGQILVDGLNAKYLSVGADFRFGADRAGDASLLVKSGEAKGFSVEIADTQTFAQMRISSTRIRQALLAGDMESAREMLGRSYRLGGKIIRGNQLGRTMGAPTANLHLMRSRLCVDGVFAARVLHGGEIYPAIANIGFRPAVDNLQKPLLEVHLLDYDSDLYERRLEVDLLHRIRGEQKFASLSALQNQILKDIDQAKLWHLSN